MLETAYAVEHDQVSMTAPSGQFLPKGGFMIYGERNYINDVPLQLYMGLVIEQSWARLVISTREDSMQGARYSVCIKPGALKRGQAAKKIKQKFVSMVEDKHLNKVKAINVGDISQMLPGDCELSEWRDLE